MTKYTQPPQQLCYNECSCLGAFPLTPADLVFTLAIGGILQSCPDLPTHLQEVLSKTLHALQLHCKRTATSAPQSFFLKLLLTSGE